MALTLTLEHFNYEGQLATIPELQFTSNESDYWLLLPLFEAIEEKTGKLIDLGDSLEMTPNEMELSLPIIEKHMESAKESQTETLLEGDDERRTELSKYLKTMFEVGIKNNVKLIAKN